MKRNKIKCWLLFLLLLIVGSGDGLWAQTFYEVIYADKQGYQNSGLMLYNDEEDCTLYLRRHTTSGNDLSIRTLSYISERNGGEDGTEKDNKQKGEEEEDEYLIMACEDDNTPIFIWLWDKDESEAQQLVPYITYDDEEEPEDWIRAKSFLELDLRTLTPEYLSKYLEPSSHLYKQICQANREALEADRTIETENQAAIDKLGDGTGIYKVIYESALAARQKKETGQQDAGNKPGNEGDNKTGNKVRQPVVGTTCNVKNDRPVMHLLIAANTKVADIGASCRTDYENIRNEMTGIAQSIGIRVKEYDVTGSNYSKARLQEQIQALQPSANDIVVFLYTGHGFRFDDQKDPYPLLAFTYNDYQPLEGNYVALSDIYDAISKKGARLNLVLSDCCNSKIGERRPLGGNTLFSRGNNNFSRKRLADLFFNAKGSLLSTAASPGEYSWCDTAGGMFTLSFIQSLRREISAMNTNEVSWQSVVDNTLKTALQRSRNSAEAQNGLKKVVIVKD